ncbi:hypothetical protein BU15DRAFT_70677 [Melanogaster broomeanus]|nr:hypothetical protein BU15DRAFT_70677 [Melanogaster broomeanus]
MSFLPLFFVPDANISSILPDLHLPRTEDLRWEMDIADRLRHLKATSWKFRITTTSPLVSNEASRRKKETKLADDEDWEDVEDDSCTSESDDSESLPDNQLTYGDTEYELVLPSGARIGPQKHETILPQSLHTDKNSALVPRKGGFGALDWGPKQSKQGIEEKLARQVVMYENLEIKDGGRLQNQSGIHPQQSEALP